VSELTDEEIKTLVSARHIPAYKLESTLGDHERGVSVRRQIITDSLPTRDALDTLPYTNYDYSYVSTASQFWLQKYVGIVIKYVI